MNIIQTLAAAAVLSAAALPIVAEPIPIADKQIELIDPTEELRELMPDYKLPELWFGSKAPPLKLSTFVKGDPVDGFTEGHVYVVEFWATWCGPCIASMPHLTKTQEKFAEKATIISVNILDRKYDREAKAFIETAEDHHTKVAGFIEEKGDTVGYTVAIENERDMLETWMMPAAQNGIPASFIVDQNGLIAWIGHPMGLDEPLEAIVAGEYDLQAAADEAEKGQFDQAVVTAFMQGIRGEDAEGVDRAEAIARVLARRDVKADAQTLNAIAWTIVDESEPVTRRDYKLAFKAARKASQLTDWKDPMILDTYTLAAFKTKKVREAIRKQKKAIRLLEKMDGVPDDVIKEFEQRLEMYEKGEG